MAAINKTSSPIGGVTQLKTTSKGQGLWADALRRLFRNKASVIGAIILLLNILMAIFAPIIAPKSYTDQVLTQNNSAPLWITHIFPSMIPKGDVGGYVTINNDYTLGTDNLGRDLLSRIIYGSRISLEVALVGPIVSIALGLLVGMVAGYGSNRVDNILMRIVDIMYAFPTFLLIILLMAFFRTSFGGKHEPGSLTYVMGQIDAAMGGMFFIFLGIGLTSWMQMARLVRGQVLSQREREYVEAARALGDTTPSIMLRHILPNILGPLIVAETLTIPTYISYEAFLSFIGLGVNPPTPSWGGMISEGSRVISTYPYQALFPALALFLVMFAFNFLGDGLRDALDPRMRGQG